MTVSFNQERLVRIKELANFPQRKERIYTYKDGKTKRISARPAIKGMIGVSDKTLWLWVKRGEFPAPIKLGNGITVWRMSEVQAWIDAQVTGEAGEVEA